MNTVKPSEAELKDWLKPVQDPELQLSLVDLGLVYRAAVDEAGVAKVDITLTSPGCPLGDEIVDMIKKRMAEHQAVNETQVQVVWEPKWDPAQMASDECKDALGIW